MNLSLAHPSCCDCLQCLNRRNPERLISPENFNDVADAAEVAPAERLHASVPVLNGSRSPMHSGILVAGQSKRLDCEASNFKFASGQQQAKADDALRPVTGVASGQADSENGRATAGINEGAGCSPNPRSAPSVSCPECQKPTECDRIYGCPDCRFVGCGGCMEGHRSEPHWTDGATSRERESQVRS